MKNITIIGAGIGGLTMALALSQKGITSTVYEQAEHIKPVGAGIILANNAMQVYEKLGLREIIEAHGNPISTINIAKADLKVLSTMDLSYFEQKYNTQNIAIHRGTLQQILLDSLKSLESTEIKLNHKLASITEQPDGYCLQFENGEQIQSTTVLAADGIHSMVRQKILPNNEIRDAKQLCWRGIAKFSLPIQYRNELNEIWGKSERFGFVQIAENTVYWYALKSHTKNNVEITLDDLVRCFSDYHPVIIDIIQSTKKERIHTANISDLKPTNIWYKDNICLIGDAIHATTPNMGQGACQAIEDAYVLAECLSKYDKNTAFERFQELRLPKAHQVTKASWMIGKVAHFENPMLMSLRNKILTLTPASVNRKQVATLFQLAEV